MSKIFLSHSSADNADALALSRWLDQSGWGDHFLDISPARGLSPGERWQEALKAAADRCQAVLFLISPAWRDSKWCLAEFLLAKQLGKTIFGVIVRETPLASLPPEMTSEWQLCDLVAGAERERFAVAQDPIVPATEISYARAGLEKLRLGLEKAGLDASTFPWPPSEDPERAPYRGLKALEAADAGVFFGRDAEVVRALDALRGMRERGVERMLVILGASGSGKSSFLRAGLLPRLKRDDRHFLPLPAIRPEGAVLSGKEGLAASLEAAFRAFGKAKARGDIRRRLAERGFAAFLAELQELGRARLEAGAALPTVVISVDQGEELFAADGRAEAEAFLSSLAGALAEPPGEGAEAIAARRRVLAVVTIRSESYVRLQTDPRLERVKPLLHPLNPIARAEFKAVVEGPAARVTDAGRRLAVEPALTEELLKDAEGADALPLLAFTLERLFVEHGGGGNLRLDEYRSFGGIRGSIEAAIEGAFAQPGREPAVPADRAERERRLRLGFIPWLAMVEPDTGERKRRVARWGWIPDGARPLLERLVAARLILRDRRPLPEGGGDEVVVEIAHEALLRQWPTLGGWLDADAEDLQRLEGVRRAAAEWARNARGLAWLVHGGERLAAAEELRRFDHLIGERGREYLSACRKRDDDARAEERRRLERERAQARGLRWLAAGLGVALVAAVLGGSWAVRQRNEANAALASVDFREGVRRAGGGRQYEALPFLASSFRLSSSPAARAALVAHLGAARWPMGIMRHDGVVRTASFSEDGERVVTASFDGTARIWDARTGAPVREPMRHDSEVVAASFSADGARVVTACWGGLTTTWGVPTASWYGTARIWDAGTGAPVGEPLRHEGKLTSASFSTDGTHVVTASDDKTARIWNAWAGSPVGRLLQHEGRVNAASFSGDGTRVVTASEDATARIWDARTGLPMRERLRHEAAVWAASFNPDGTRVVTASLDGTARIWDAATGSATGEALRHEAAVRTASFNADGTRVVTASLDGTARIWDARTGSPAGEPLRHEGVVVAASFSADGTRVLTASLDGTARIWDARTGSPIGERLPHENAVWTASFSADGTRVVTASDDETARIWDTRTRLPLALRLQHEGTVLAASFGADGTRVVTASDDETARIWDARTGAPVGEPLRHERRVNAASFSADGTRVVTASEDGTARIWDAGTGSPVREPLRHEGIVNAAAFSADGERVVTASFDRTARIWDARTGSPAGEPLRHEGVVKAASFSADGTRVVTASEDSTARIWDARTGAPVGEPLRHEGIVNAASFSADGERVLTASWDRTARIWDARTGAPVGEPLRHQGGVNAASFSADGERVLTASWDRTARIWDARTGAPAGEPLRHQEGVHAASFSADGERVLTASWDRTARIWDARTGALVGEPLRHEAAVLAASFSADGTRIVTASEDSTARIWDVDVLPPSASDLALLAEAGEVLSGYTLNESRALVSLSDWPGRVEDLRRCVADAPRGESTVRSYLRWLLDDPWTRTISPYSSVIVPDFIRAQTRLCIPEARRAVEEAFVGHPVLQEPFECPEPAWKALAGSTSRRSVR